MFKALSNYLRATKLFNPINLHKHEGYKAMKPYLKANSLELDANKLLADLQRKFVADSLIAKQQIADAYQLECLAKLKAARAKQQLAEAIEATKAKGKEIEQTASRTKIPKIINKKSVSDNSYYSLEILVNHLYIKYPNMSYMCYNTESFHYGRLLSLYVDDKSEFVLCQDDSVMFGHIIALVTDMVDKCTNKVDVYYYTYHLVITKCATGNFYSSLATKADSFLTRLLNSLKDEFSSSYKAQIKSDTTKNHDEFILRIYYDNKTDSLIKYESYIDFDTIYRRVATLLTEGSMEVDVYFYSKRLSIIKIADDVTDITHPDFRLDSELFDEIPLSTIVDVKILCSELPIAYDLPNKR